MSSTALDGFTVANDIVILPRDAWSLRSAWFSRMRFRWSMAAFHKEPHLFVLEGLHDVVAAAPRFMASMAVSTDA